MPKNAKKSLIDSKYVTRKILFLRSIHALKPVLEFAKKRVIIIQLKSPAPCLMKKQTNSFFTILSFTKYSTPAGAA